MYHIIVEMSEVAKPTEPTPAATSTEGTESATAPSTTPAAATTETTPAVDSITPAGDTPAAPSKEETTKDGEAKVEAVPANEGTLGYKGPGLIQ